MKPYPVIALVAFAPFARGAESGPAFAPPPAEAWAKLPPHPRLFADAGRWEALNAQVVSDPVAKRLFALVRERAEGVLTLPSLDLPAKGINLHGPMRQMQGRLACLAMTYKLTGDDRFLARSRREMDELAATPHWRPGHFLSTSEATTAMALGLDWLYHDLTPGERERYTAAIVEKGLKASLKAEDDKESWLTSGGNWGPVCHGGMALGALAVAEREPELARRVVERSVAGVRFAAKNYAPAGAHSEGPGYWAYGTNFYFLLADALRTTFGTTGGLETAPGMLQTGDYNLQMTTPTGRMFNTADSVPEFGFEPAMFWFARRLGRYDLAAPTLDRLDEMRAVLVSDGAQPDASRLVPVALIWWDPALPAKPAAAAGPLTWWSRGGPQPQAVMRSAWGDPRAAFVGFKAGKAGEGHSHMDVGSFVLEADGVRWAVDLGRDQYSGPRKHGLGDDLFRATQDSKRWAIFRNGAESHNILRFNGAVPWVDAASGLRPAADPATGPAFVADLTPAYQGQVAAVRRGVALRPDRAVVVRDEWEAGDRPALVAWQWLTFAAAAPEKNGVTLAQDGQTLRLRVFTPGAHVAVEDVSKAPNPWDSPNPGLKRVVVRVSTPANARGQLVVVAGGGAAADPVPAKPLADW
jgi:hypothetical protein